MVWAINTVYFHTIHSIHEADIIFTYSMDSIAVFYFYFSIILLQKHIKYMKATRHLLV